jgi:hypothetical protein
MYFYCYVSVFELLRVCICTVTFLYVFSGSLCLSVYCLCVNVYWTTATGISGHFSTNVTEVFSVVFSQL